MINFREGWRGYLWQGRFSSFVMDEAHLIVSIRYIERNPVRAKLVTDPGDYKWSSYNAYLTGKDDKLVKVRPLLQIVHSWKEFVETLALEVEAQSIRMHERTGSPLGNDLFNDSFINRLELEIGKPLRKKKPGTKGPRKKDN
jgi:putative transposase